MATVVVTRSFALKDVDIDPHIFNDFRNAVNHYIKEGIKLPVSLFENDSLIAVKYFSQEIKKCKCDLKERIHRFAAQYAYFAIRELARSDICKLYRVDSDLNAARNLIKRYRKYKKFAP